MAVVAGFHCDVISCEPARRVVRRGSVEASGSGGVQRVWAWLRGRSDLDPRSRTVETDGRTVTADRITFPANACSIDIAFAELRNISGPASGVPRASSVHRPEVLAN